ARRLEGGQDAPIRSLRLTPVKTTDKPSEPWDRVIRAGQADRKTPSTDKESLGILRGQAAERYPPGPDGRPSHEEQIVETLRQLRFVGQTLQGALARPGGTEFIPDDDAEDGSGEEFNTYARGIPHFIQADGRVHTQLYQTMETGRASSSKPPMQNLSSRREADYEAIVKSVGLFYKWPLRSIVQFDKDPWGHPVVGCEHDLAGAELFMMAVQAGDPKMIDHCRRNVLPEEGYDREGKPDPKGKYPHPDYHDIHGSIAVQAFKLRVSTQEAAAALGLKVGDPCPSTKAGLKAIGKGNLRKGAKCIVFAIPYGRGDE